MTPSLSATVSRSSATTPGGIAYPIAEVPAVVTLLGRWFRPLLRKVCNETGIHVDRPDASGCGVLGVMGMPRKPAVELTTDNRLYFNDSRNTRWRIYDIAYGPPLAAPFKRRRLKLGDERATDRCFVSENGDQRRYHFTRDDSHDLLVESLGRQL